MGGDTSVFIDVPYNHSSKTERCKPYRHLYITHLLLFVAVEQQPNVISLNSLCFFNDFSLWFQEAVPDDNIDLLLENLEQPSGLSLQNEDCGGSDRRSVLHVEHR